MRAAGDLRSETGDKLVRAIRSVLQEAIDAGGSSLRDHRQADGSLGYFQHNFRVYDREGQACVRRACRGTIARRAQNGRSTFYCPTCQD
jgi:formamidopyrimidine-DNA glycosylase